MNQRLQQYARKFLIINLLKLPEDLQLNFKRMYSYNYITTNGAGSFAKGKPLLDKPIEEVVQDMPEDKLDWAMVQVEATILRQEDVL